MDEHTFSKLVKVSEIYSPSYPIEIKQLFSGRNEQIRKAMAIIPQKGLHAVIYGDRGVGKTSFSNIIRIFFQNQSQVAKVSCNSNDTFESLWRSILSKFTVPYEIARQTVGFKPTTLVEGGEVLLSDLVTEKIYAIPTILKYLPNLSYPIIIIDEFDRLDGNVFNKRLMTDLIKAVSDSISTVTIIIIGVSEDVSNLIQEHESIERNLAQIYMPTMNPDEIREIILKGEQPLGITYDQPVIENIIELSSGFPHFTHSLCSNAVRTAINLQEEKITVEHLKIAIRETVDDAHESLRNGYRIATLATKANIFKEVLFAASVAPTDEYGYFQANDLEEILEKILHKPIRVNNFLFHLGKFCISERGEILKSVGVKNRQKYKFKNPLMKAFIRLNSVNDKNISSIAE